jgi:hypothetical protein
MIIALSSATMGIKAFQRILKLQVHRLALPLPPIWIPGFSRFLECPRHSPDRLKPELQAAGNSSSSGVQSVALDSARASNSGSAFDVRADAYVLSFAGSQRGRWRSGSGADLSAVDLAKVEGRARSAPCEPAGAHFIKTLSSRWLSFDSGCEPAAFAGQPWPACSPGR